MEIIDTAPFLFLVSIALGLLGAAIVAYRHRYLFGLFSRHSHYVDVGPLTFRLNYIRSLRNPSGRMIFTWTDELDRTYEQMDPRVFVIETTGSMISRYLRQAPELTVQDYANAVKKHIGHGKGWFSVTKTDIERDPIFRWIAFCVVHMAIEPAPASEAITE